MQARCADNCPRPPRAVSVSRQHVACVDRCIRTIGVNATGFGSGSRSAAHGPGAFLRPRWHAVREDSTRLGGSDHSPEAELGPQNVVFRLPTSASTTSAGDGRGRLRFFDFEYAGWDDPAKLLCDFRCQVELRVPPPLWQEFLGKILEPLPHADCAPPVREVAVTL